MTYLCSYLGFESYTVCEEAVDLNMVTKHFMKHELNLNVNFVNRSES